MSRLAYLVTSSLSVRFLRGQLSFLRRRGYEITVISAPGPELAQAAREEEVATVAVPLEREIRPLKDLLALWHLMWQFRALRPEIVAAATPKAALLGMLAAWCTRVPVRVYLHYGLRLETTHGLKRWLLTQAERLACFCATRVICISHSLRTRCLALRLTSGRKAVVLAHGSHTGVDTDHFRATDALRQQAAELRLRHGIPREAPVVGFIGRLTQDKGVADLLRAFDQILPRIPEARLLLVGDFESGDPLPEACVRRLSEHPQVVLTGYVDDPLPYYGMMNVLAFPSYREGFGGIALEAAALGLPVAGYQSTGVVDSVADGLTGTLVPRGDAQALADAVCRYLRSPELSRRHGQAGRARALRDFQPEAVWGALAQEFATLERRAKMPRHTWAYRFKRLFDVTAAGLGLILLAPLLGLIALAIGFSMGWPILFRQQRPGLDGRPFGIYKFRTMSGARDARGHLLPDTQRLTRLGRFLRNTSLDELPELLNVLRGEMSLVGPRPLLVAYLDRYTPEQSRRHELLPGITGWAQVHGRNGISWEEKFQLDLWYVDHWSLGLDLRILAQTLGKVLRREGINSAADVTMPEFLGTAALHPESPVAGRAAMPRIYLSPPHMSGEERQLLLEAFDSNWIAPLGPQVDAFEREFAAAVGAEYAVALSSGTAALHLALLIVGVRPGDEVATATLTFAATANAIRYVGATPVFLDSQAHGWNLDPDLLAEELEEGVRRGRPLKAVLAVDLFGHCADYEAIRRLCQFYEVPLIEDAAEALGSSYAGRAAGTLGDIGCFSFNGNKILTTSGGGMLVTAHRVWAERARYLATQARDPVPHYEHSTVGYNYRLSNLLAAVGRGQLRVLEERVRQRRTTFAHYRQALHELPGISFLPEHPQEYANRWLSVMLVDPERFGATPEELRLALERANIESRSVWKPMHQQPVYAGYRIRGGSVSERRFAQGLCLPSGSNLSHAERQRVVEIIQQVASGAVARRPRLTPVPLRGTAVLSEATSPEHPVHTKSLSERP